MAPRLEGVDLQQELASPVNLARVRAAQAVFFSGGAQALIVDTLQPGGRPTALLQAIWALYERGGLVVGTSAGAAVMSSTMFRDAPDTLQVLRGRLREGREIDRGLGFVGPELFIDQHFLRRGRVGRMLPLMLAKGYRLGLGIDEDSAAIIKGQQIEVIGSRGAPLVQRFRARFPRAVITVLEGLSLSLRESLIAGRLDLALLFDPMPSPQLRYEALMRERLLLVAPPGSRLPVRVGLAALSAYPMLLPSAPNAIRVLVDSVLGPRGIALQIRAEVGAVNTVLTLVARGEGCSILPESALAGRALLHAPIGPPAIRNALVLVTPLARPASRLTRETAQMLRELDFRSVPEGA